MISHQVASKLHGIQMAFTPEQLTFMNNLSEADRARIERIVNTRLKTINTTDIIAVRHEDEFFYQQLNTDFKYHVDKMVTLYMEDYELAPAVAIADEDKDFYESLNSNSKEKVDRYIALKLDEYEDLDFSDPFYSSLDQAEQNIVDDISANILKSKTNLGNIDLPQQDIDFLDGLSDSDRALAELSIANNVASIADKPEFEITSGEQIFYQNLSNEEKSSLDHIATAFIESTVDNLESHLNDEDLGIYNSLSPAQQASFDKVLAKRIQNFVKADRYTLEIMDDRDLQRLTELQLAGGADISSFLNDAEIPDDSPLKTLAAEDEERFVRLLSNASNLVVMNTSSKIKDAALSVERNQEIEKILASNKPSLPGALTTTEQPFYGDLSSTQDAAFDELMAQQLTHYVEENPQLLRTDFSNTNQVTQLDNQLNNDFDIDKIVGGNGRLKAAVGEMSPEDKSLLKGSLISATKFIISNNKDQLLSLTGLSNNSAGFVAQISSSDNPALSSANIPRNSNDGSRDLTVPGTDSADLSASIAAANNTSGVSPNASSTPNSIDLTPTGNQVSDLPITTGERSVAQIVETSRPDYTSELSAEERQVFGDLTLEEKQFMDEAISGTISEYITDNSRILDVADSDDPQNTEMIDAKLRSDFNINKLATGSTTTPPSSLTNRSPSFRSDLSTVLAEMAKSVIVNHAVELKALSSPSESPSIAQNTNTSSPDTNSNTASGANGTSSTSTFTTTTSPTSTVSNTPVVSPSASFTNLLSPVIGSLQSTLKNSALITYKQLTPSQRQLFDNVLPQRLLRTYKMNPEVFTDLNSNNDVVFQEALSKINNHANVRIPMPTDQPGTRNALARLDDIEKDQISRLLASSMRTIISDKGPQLKAVLDRDGVPAVSPAPNLVAENSRTSRDEQRPRFGSITAAANPANRQRVSITEDDYNFYYNLDTDKRNMIDKVVALRIVNKHAIDGQHNLAKDKDYLNKLPVNERRSIKRLAQFLDGDNMNDIKVNIVQEDLNYYDNLSNKKKDDINRLIVGDIFNFTNEHNIYGVRGEDQKILSTFNPREKELFNLLHNIRSQTHNVFGNRLDLDRTIIESQNIIGEVKSFDNQEYQNVMIEGGLYAIEGGRPLGNFALNLVDNNGNVIASTMTTANGSFSFRNIDAARDYTIQSSEVGTTRAKDRYFIKNLAVAGNDQNILSNKYDEFFLNDGTITNSVQNSLKEISNLIKANPGNTIFIRLINEEYQQAMSINNELIRQLNQNGVENTSIKFKRELPGQTDNPFEGLFRNKVELYVESDQRIAGNNYYSFLVRRDTNLQALSEELKVPEKVLIEENNLPSNVIARNSIIRVWKPESNPSMSLLVNVSDFYYQEYTVRNGENVITIADRLRLPEELIMEVNNLTSPELSSGQVIQLYVRR